jgi:hypothetical protein
MLYEILRKQGSGERVARRKLEVGLRYVEHVLAQFSSLEFDAAIPKVTEALIAYSAVDSTLRAAMTGSLNGVDESLGVTYSLVFSVREKVRDALMRHVRWRRDVLAEAALADVDLQDVVDGMSIRLRDAFTR